MMACGMNDTLVSTAGAEMMWGDAATVDAHADTGFDLFVFAPGNGRNGRW